MTKMAVNGYHTRESRMYQQELSYLTERKKVLLQAFERVGKIQDKRIKLIIKHNSRIIELQQIIKQRKSEVAASCKPRQKPLYH